MAQPIIIQNFQRGTASSPYVGFGRMVGMDIYRKPGIIQAGVALNPSSGYSGMTGIPTGECVGPDGTKYVVTSVGEFYKNGILIHNIKTPLHDVIVFGDYVIISGRGTFLDTYGPLSVSPIYNVSALSGLDVSQYGYKKMFVGQDNVIYIGNETKLAAIQNTSSSIGSWSINPSCLSTGVPSGRIIQTIVEQNRYVVIVTSLGGGYKDSVVYFMDRGTLDPSRTSFFLSIGVPIPETKINQIINQDNRLVLIGNDTGTIYTTNQTSYQVLGVIPNRLQTQSYITYPNAIAIVENEILFGIGGNYNAAYDTVYGVYSMRGNSIVVKNTISTAQYGQTNSVFIGSIASLGLGSYNVGWNNAGSVGMDVADFHINTDFNCWFESQMYTTGTAENPETFQTIQFSLGNNFPSGMSIKTQYRLAVNEAWKDGPLFQSAVVGQVNSFHGKFATPKTTNIQLKVLFDTDVGIYGQNIELQSIIIK